MLSGVVVVSGGADIGDVVVGIAAVAFVVELLAVFVSVACAASSLSSRS